MNVIRLDADDDVFPLRIVSDKAAKAGGVAVGVRQLQPDVVDAGRRLYVACRSLLAVGDTFEVLEP